jgi:hypothetical protein
VAQRGVEAARQVLRRLRRHQLVHRAADGGHVGEELVHGEAFELGRQLLSGGADGRNLAEIGIERGEDGRFVRMEIEVDVQLAGKQALQPQAAAQAAVDQLADGGAIAQVDVFAAVGVHDVGLHFDHDRHQETLAVRIEPELDLLDGADLDAEEHHRRADLQPLRRAREVQHVLAALAEPAAARQQQGGGDRQRERAEDENADQGGVGFAAHGVCAGRLGRGGGASPPRVRKWRTLGWPFFSASCGCPVAIMVRLSVSR